EPLTTVVVGGGAIGGTQVDGSISQGAAWQFLPRNLPASFFVFPLQRMQKRVPLPNCTCTLTSPCMPSSESEKPGGGSGLIFTRSLPSSVLIFTGSLPSSCWAEFLVVVFLYFHFVPVFVPSGPPVRVRHKSSVVL